MDGIQGRVALVTGASRGIGLAIAQSLAKRGASVAITARGRGLDEAQLTLQQALGPADARALAIACDVRDPADVDTLFERVYTQFGRIDILVNNVGGSLGSRSFSESTDEYLREVFELNVFTTFSICRRVVPRMKQRGAGRIINIASVFGRESGGGAIYNAAKSAVIALTKAMATELAPHGIRVNSVAPGPTRFSGGSWDRRFQENTAGTEEFIRNQVPLGRCGTPQEIADVVCFLASDQAAFVTGACWTVDGGQSKTNS